jgi:hypothetical protein
MLNYQTFYQSELVKLLKSEIDRLKDNLVTAHTTMDFSAYKHQVGVIDGLKRALDLVDEAETIANGGERRK